MEQLEREREQHHCRQQDPERGVLRGRAQRVAEAHPRRHVGAAAPVPRHRRSPGTGRRGRTAAIETAIALNPTWCTSRSLPSQAERGAEHAEVDLDRLQADALVARRRELREERLVRADDDRLNSETASKTKKR